MDVKFRITNRVAYVKALVYAKVSNKTPMKAKCRLSALTRPTYPQLSSINYQYAYTAQQVIGYIISIKT